MLTTTRKEAESIMSEKTIAQMSKKELLAQLEDLEAKLTAATTRKTRNKAATPPDGHEKGAVSITGQQLITVMEFVDEQRGKTEKNLISPKITKCYGDWGFFALIPGHSVRSTHDEARANVKALQEAIGNAHAELSTQRIHPWHWEDSWGADFAA